MIKVTIFLINSLKLIDESLSLDFELKQFQSKNILIPKSIFGQKIGKNDHPENFILEQPLNDKGRSFQLLAALAKL